VLKGVKTLSTNSDCAKSCDDGLEGGTTDVNNYTFGGGVNQKGRIKTTRIQGGKQMAKKRRFSRFPWDKTKNHTRGTGGDLFLGNNRFGGLEEEVGQHWRKKRRSVEEERGMTAGGLQML